MLSIGAAFPVRRQRRGWSVGRVLAVFVARWEAAASMRLARRQVAEMDAHMLADIGVSRAQLLFELDRPRLPPRP